MFSKWGTIATAFVASLLTVPALHAQGLYADKNATGDLNDQDYWWSKFDAMMLELAIKQHQPEGRIAVDVAIFERRLEDLTKKYPKNEEIAKWKARAHEVEAKINPNAPRNTNFTTQCPWDEANFAQLWVNLHWAKAAIAQNDYTTAYSDLQNVEQNYPIMLAPDRMKDYPEDLRKWVTDSKPEADKLYKEAKAKAGD